MLDRTKVSAILTAVKQHNYIRRMKHLLHNNYSVLPAAALMIIVTFLIISDVSGLTLRGGSTGIKNKKNLHHHHRSLEEEPTSSCGNAVTATYETVDTDYDHIFGQTYTNCVVPADETQSERGSTTVTMELYQDVVICDLDVYIDISHTWSGDLEVTLIGPDGTTQAVLVADECDYSDNMVELFDDEAAVSISDNSAYCDDGGGSLIPQTPLSVFDNTSARGTWTLLVTDDATGDSGYLNEWKLMIQTGTCSMAPSSAPSQAPSTAPSTSPSTSPTPDPCSDEAVETTWVDTANTDYDYVFGVSHNTGCTAVSPEGETSGTSTITMDIEENVYICGLDVYLDIEHTYSGDLEVSLVGPDGTTSAMLIDNMCLNTDNIVETFSDGGVDIAEDWNTYCQDGGENAVKPASPLNAFDGLYTQGTWNLVITDTHIDDTGYFNEIQLMVTECAPGFVFSTEPSTAPSDVPSSSPSSSPSQHPSLAPSASPSMESSMAPSSAPSTSPIEMVSSAPSSSPSMQPSATPSAAPSASPVEADSMQPSSTPSSEPSASPVEIDSNSPSAAPSAEPSRTRKDTDGDGIFDRRDACPRTGLDQAVFADESHTINSDGCAIDDLCPCDGSYATGLDYRNCISNAVDSFVEQGLLNRRQRQTCNNRAEAMMSCATSN